MAHDIKHPDLYADIVAYCASRGIRHSRFGQDALGDASLIPDLADGRELRISTQAAIRRYMATGVPRKAARRKQAA